MLQSRQRTMHLGKTLLACLGLALLSHAASAQIVRSDNSPVCNTYLPQCEAKCKRGEAYIFVCAAGNGPQGGPYIICRCAAPFMPNPPQQSAQLVLSNWPGSKACNDKTWINDCTSKMTAQVNGSSVLLTPAVSEAFHERCDPVKGVVIGPKGTQAAVSFPQYPIGVTSTGPDGTLQIDFSATASDDPNNMDWSQCVVSYKVIQGSFLNPVGGMYANAMGRGMIGEAQGLSQRSSGQAAAAAGVLNLLAAVLAGVLLLA